MAKGISTRLTAAAGRRFGLTVGGAFGVLAGIAWWRGHPSLVTAFASLSGLLILAGVLIPTHLGPVERAWMGLAHAISKVTTPIVMSVLYFVVFTPMALLRRTLGGDPLQHTANENSYWHPRDEGKRKTASLERQY